ncbi:hypothetical protein MMC17_006369 [Xylographa soralifera]|nr:hypothetical protein [Xylographa soralifera]
MSRKPLIPQRPRSASQVLPALEVVNRTAVGQLLSPRLNVLPRPIPDLRAPSTTPYAIRALQQRRAAVRTPAQRRRSSGRQYRETPRDTLRDLSKILSKTTKTIATSSQSIHSSVLSVALSERAFSDEEDDKPRPRLSMPIHELEEDDDDDRFRAPRTRLSIHSQEYSDVERSVEMPRRAFDEQSLSRLSRGSLENIPINDHISEIDEAEIPANDQNINGGDIINQVERGYEEDHPGEASVLGANTEDLRRMTGHISSGLFSLPNDIEFPNTLYDDTTTVFAFDIPENPDGSGHVSKVNLNSTRTSEYSKPRMDIGLEFPSSQKAGVRKTSRHGITYPRVPESVVNKYSTSLAKSKIKKDTLSAIMKASDWFLEQVGTDLGAYAKHAGRKTVDETDVVVLLRRHVLP